MQNLNAPRDEWTVFRVLTWTVSYLEKNSIENPRVDAEILLAHALRCTRLDLYLHYDLPLQADELTRYKQCIKRRVKKEPVAYITGKKEFWSLDFKVNPSVLIPRPDTECLVETVLEYAKTQRDGKINTVLELGVGSGAISIALAHEYPRWCFYALDVSYDAVIIARQNARVLLKDGPIRFWVGNWCSAIGRKKMGFDIIISNPPYISSSEIDNLAPEIKKFEPLKALDGGCDGLLHCRSIIDSAMDYLLPDGILIMEMGFDQRAGIEKIAESAKRVRQITFKRDYSGHYRIAILET